MFRSFFGSSKKTKEEDHAETVPNDLPSDYVFVDSGPNPPGLYPQLNGGYLPYALLPTNVVTDNVNSIQRDNFLDDVPFQLSPLLNNDHRDDLEVLLLKSKSILENKHLFRYEYSFDLERSVLRT